MNLNLSWLASFLEFDPKEKQVSSIDVMSDLFRMRIYAKHLT